MDLPPEIRDHIYKAFLTPFMAPFKMLREYYARRNRRATQFDGIMLSISSSRYTPRHPLKPDNVLSKRLEERGMRRGPEARRKHPSRQYNYIVHATMKQVRRGFCIFETRDLLNLSNTNSVVRKELAEVFWARTCICLDEFHLTRFEQFLRDRPAIWGGIKELEYTMTFERKTPEDLESEYVSAPTKQFFKICQRIAGMVQLETLRLKVIIPDDQLLSLLKDSATPSWVLAIRCLNVVKEFTLDLEPQPSDALSWNDLEIKMTNLRTRYQQMMEEKLRPYSLRKEVKPLSEMNEVEK